MRTGLLVAAVLVISLANTGTGQGLTEVFDAIGDLVDSPERQSDINDNIPAVFGATLAASLFANLIFQASQNYCRCGIEKTGSRIVNGEDVSPVNKYPWNVALVYKENLDSLGPISFPTSASTLRKRVICGGALVASKYVVTNAHCVVKSYQANNQPSTLQPPGDITVRIGDHDLGTEGETTIPEKTIAVKKITIHPDHMFAQSFPRHTKDIAVLELAEELDLTVYTPVCLPRAGITEEGTGKMYGWGSTGASLTDVLPPTSFPNILQEAELRVCTASEIMNIEAATGAQFGDGQLCTVGETGVTPALFDNGGPFTSKSNDQHVLLGSFSWGDSTSIPGGVLAGNMDTQFFMNTKVSFFRSWLEEQMPGARTCKNGFSADKMMQRSYSWRRLAQQQAAEHNRKLAEKKRKRERRKNKKEREEKKRKSSED